MDFAVDSHFHIWNLEQFEYPWPNSSTPEIHRNFTASDYESSVTSTPVKYGVFVQCLINNPNEARWVINQSKDHPFIKGVVAGLNLTAHDELKRDLENLSQHTTFVGCRHILDFEDPDWITKESVLQGIEMVGHYGKTFDLLLRPPLLKYIPKIVRALPNVKFVVDHIAKPYIKDGKIEPWKREISEIAKYPNVHCKISGLVTEANLTSWKNEDFIPYVNYIVEVFGIDRCMYGSDWPVCTMAGAKYQDVFELASSLLSHLCVAEREKFFKENAINFYNLNL